MWKSTHEPVPPWTLQVWEHWWQAIPCLDCWREVRVLVALYSANGIWNFLSYPFVVLVVCILQKGCTRLASDKICQLLAHGRWFSPGTPASSTTKTGHHEIAGILLKVALKHQKSKSNRIKSAKIMFGSTSVFSNVYLITWLYLPQFHHYLTFPPYLDYLW